MIAFFRNLFLIFTYIQPTEEELKHLILNDKLFDLDEYIENDIWIDEYAELIPNCFDGHEFCCQNKEYAIYPLI